MTVIVEHDTSLVEMFQSTLGSDCPVLESVAGLDEHLRANPHEYAAVLGPSVGTEAATTFAESARLTYPALSVILVRGRVESALLAAAMRSGVREVVETRDLTGLSGATHRAYTLAQAMAGGPVSQHGSGSEGRVLTVFSTKGGVGKSVVATNLAAALADQGSRVCLVDLDVQGGDAAIMLQLFPSHSLGDLGGSVGGLDPASVRSLLTEHSERLSVLAAPLQPHAQETVTANSVDSVLKVLRTMFDVVVVDTSGSFDDYALHAFDHSDTLLLVGTLDIPSLKSLKQAAETLDLLNIARSHWRLVLNRADSKVGLDPKEFATTLELDIATSIPSSVEVPASVNRGEAIVRALPKHAVSQSIRALARSLVAEPVVDSVAPHTTRGSHLSESEQESTPRRGLLRRKVR